MSSLGRNGAAATIPPALCAPWLLVVHDPAGVAGLVGIAAIASLARLAELWLIHRKR